MCTMTKRQRQMFDEGSSKIDAAADTLEKIVQGVDSSRGDIKPEFPVLIITHEEAGLSGAPAGAETLAVQAPADANDIGKIIDRVYKKYHSCKPSLVFS